MGGFIGENRRWSAILCDRRVPQTQRTFAAGDCAGHSTSGSARHAPFVAAEYCVAKGPSAAFVVVFVLWQTDSAILFPFRLLVTYVHEMAHMWFGDLVTMKWWNGIWLNEAFATFMEVACCNEYRPDWKRWAAFSLERST